MMLWLRRNERLLWSDGLAFSGILHPVYQPGGQGNGNERIDNAQDGDIGERQGQHDEIGEHIAHRKPPAEHMRDGQRQRVVAAGRPALPDDEPHAHAHEHRPGERGGQRIGGEVGQHRRKLLPHFEEAGHAQGRYHGDFDELPAEESERQQIAGGVQHRGDIGRGDAEPVLEEQHQPQNAALRNGGALVDVVKAEGSDHRAEHNQQKLTAGQADGELFFEGCKDGFQGTCPPRVIPFDGGGANQLSRKEIHCDRSGVD